MSELTNKERYKIGELFRMHKERWEKAQSEKEKAFQEGFLKAIISIENILSEEDQKWIKKK